MRNERSGVGGFTLIELMITVAVIGILAAVAYPSYTNYIQRGKITEATSSLSELRLRAEKWFSDNRTYQNAGGTDVGFNEVIQNAKYFTYNCTAATATAVGAAAGALIDGASGAGVGAGIGLLMGSAIGSSTANASAYSAQQRYDIGYTQCMYAKGHKVPVSGRFAAANERPAAPRYRTPPPPPPPSYMER